MRRFCIISYDVVDSKRRTKLYKLLQHWGDRIQYSVFCCQLNPRERLQLTNAMKEILHATEDQAFLVDAGRVEGENPMPQLTYLGRIWKPDARTQVV